MITILSVEFLGSYSGTGKEQVIMHLICDTFEELASFTSDRYEPLQGSVAHIVSNQLDYEMMSDGTWVVKQTADVQSLVSLISQVQGTVVNLDADVRGIMFPALRKLVDGGNKNMLNWSATSSSGITIVDNGDGTFTLSGTASGTVSILLGYIYGHGGESLYLSGCPSGGNYTSGYSLIITDSGGNTQGYDEGDGYEFTRPVDESFFRVYCRVRAGTYSDLIFKPMVTYIEYQMVSRDFVPYSPSNAELYRLIRGYHP